MRNKWVPDIPAIESTIAEFRCESCKWHQLREINFNCVFSIRSNCRWKSTNQWLISFREMLRCCLSICRIRWPPRKPNELASITWFACQPTRMVENLLVNTFTTHDFHSFWTSNWMNYSPFLLVAEHLIAQHSAIKMLHSRVKLILSYIKSIENGSLPANTEILREAYSLSQRLPVIQSSTFREEYYTVNSCDHYQFETRRKSLSSFSSYSKRTMSVLLHFWAHSPKDVTMSITLWINSTCCTIDRVADVCVDYSSKEVWGLRWDAEMPSSQTRSNANRRKNINILYETYAFLHSINKSPKCNETIIIRGISVFVLLSKRHKPFFPSE